MTVRSWSHVTAIAAALLAANLNMRMITVSRRYMSLSSKRTRDNTGYLVYKDESPLLHLYPSARTTTTTKRTKSLWIRDISPQPDPSYFLSSSSIFRATQLRRVAHILSSSSTCRDCDPPHHTIPCRRAGSNEGETSHRRCCLLSTANWGMHTAIVARRCMNLSAKEHAIILGSPFHFHW